MNLGLTKSRDNKLLQDLLDKKLRVIVIFEDDYLNHIARIAYKDIQQDNYTYRIGEYNIYKGEEWGFCDFCKRHDCYFIVPNETIEGVGSEIPKDLAIAAESFAFGSLDEVVLYGCTLSGRRACFIAGAKWQADHAPLPEDTVLFNKGVEEGKRLMMEEAVEADVNTYCDIVAGKKWAEFVVEMPTKNLSDKVRIIIVKED